MKKIILITLLLLASTGTAADTSVEELSDLELCREWDTRIKMHSVSTGFFASLWSPSSKQRKAPEMSFMRVSDLIREREHRELACTTEYAT